MAEIVTFGELMLRLAPEGYNRFIQADKYGATYGGGEANVAVSLGGFGCNVAFVSKMPNHEIGQAGINYLRRFGVNTDFIVRGGNRVGIYYLEKGAAQRPSKVIYDRTGSAISQSKKEDFNWNEIFKDAKWFHITGITPALSDSLGDICLEGCKIAKSLGITVSCDLNYRKKLWSCEKASKVMGEICKYVDVCISNEEDAYNVFGIKPEETNVECGKINKNGYVEVAKKLTERFGFKYTGITLRTSISASDNKWAGMLYNGQTGESYFSREYNVHIVDRVGAGDSFAGGLIYSLVNKFDFQKAIEFAVAAGCLKHSIEGDFNLVSVEEVEKLADGDSTGRVLR